MKTVRRGTSDVAAVIAVLLIIGFMFWAAREANASRRATQAATVAALKRSMLVITHRHAGGLRTDAKTDVYYTAVAPTVVGGALRVQTLEGDVVEISGDITIAAASVVLERERKAGRLPLEGEE